MIPSHSEQVYAASVPDGWLIAFNQGEFGCKIYHLTHSLRERYDVANECVIGLVATPTGILAPAGLDHGSWGRGGVLRLVVNNRGRYSAEWIGRFTTASYAYSIDADGNLFVASGRGLFEVDRRGRFATLHLSNWDHLYPSALVLARDGSVYLSMRGAIAHLKKTASGDAWNEQWLVPAECPRIDSHSHDADACRCRAL